MADEKLVYECHNAACVLGSRKDPGRFTGGITPEQRALLTGEPIESLEEGKDCGAGVCPNCGELGTPVVAENGKQEEHVSIVGSDPLQDLHNELGPKVASGELSSEDAQAQLEKAVVDNG